MFGDCPGDVWACSHVKHPDSSSHHCPRYVAQIMVAVGRIDMECPVCLDSNIDARACKLRCGHHLCNHCIVKLERPLCPSCRAPIFPLPAETRAAEQPPASRDNIHPTYFNDPSLMDQQSSRVVAAWLPSSDTSELHPLLQGGSTTTTGAHLQSLRYARYSPPHHGPHG